jgi:hypothetical protein
MLRHPTPVLQASSAVSPEYIWLSVKPGMPITSRVDTKSGMETPIDDVHDLRRALLA